MKVAIYARVSTEEQDLNSQIEMCKRYCEIHKYEVVGIYQDKMTGTSQSRPEFNKLLEAMRSHQIACIMVSKIDRVGRSLSHLISLFNEFNRRGVHFIAVTQNIDTSSSAGKLQLHILSAFAEYERNLISERTKEGLAGKKNVGKRGKDKKKRKNEGYIARYRKGGVKKVGGSIYEN